MVAYALRAQFPAEVEKLVVMMHFLPGVGGWEAVYNNPAILALPFQWGDAERSCKGRERTYFEHFWNNFAADKTRSIPEADRKAYAEAYSRPGRMRAGWAYFVSFQQAAKDFATVSNQLNMPVLAIGRREVFGRSTGAADEVVASDVTVVVLKKHRTLDSRGKPQGNHRRAR